MKTALLVTFLLSLMSPVQAQDDPMPVPCTQNPPSVTLTPEVQSVLPGQQAPITLTIRNMDTGGCMARKFIVLWRGVSGGGSGMYLPNPTFAYGYPEACLLWPGEECSQPFDMKIAATITAPSYYWPSVIVNGLTIPAKAELQFEEKYCYEESVLEQICELLGCYHEEEPYP